MIVENAQRCSAQLTCSSLFTLSVHGLRIRTVVGQIVEHLEQSSLRGPHALHPPSPPSFPCVLCCEVRYWSCLKQIGAENTLKQSVQRGFTDSALIY